MHIEGGFAAGDVETAGRNNPAKAIGCGLGLFLGFTLRKNSLGMVIATLIKRKPLSNNLRKGGKEKAACEAISKTGVNRSFLK